LVYSSKTSFIFDTSGDCDQEKSYRWSQLLLTSKEEESGGFGGDDDEDRDEAFAGFRRQRLDDDIGAEILLLP
jgi:hypothetical protein